MSGLLRLAVVAALSLSTPPAAQAADNSAVATEAAWYAVSKRDQTISPDLERFLAKRMNATTTQLNAGHLSLVSHSKEVADMILAVAGRAK